MAAIAILARARQIKYARNAPPQPLHNRSTNPPSIAPAACHRHRLTRKWNARRWVRGGTVEYAGPLMAGGISRFNREMASQQPQRHINTATAPSRPLSPPPAHCLPRHAAVSARPPYTPSTRNTRATRLARPLPSAARPLILRII